MDHIREARSLAQVPDPAVRLDREGERVELVPLMDAHDLGSDEQADARSDCEADLSRIT